jgi:hypothetical protein
MQNLQKQTVNDYNNEDQNENENPFKIYKQGNQ